MSIGKQHCIPSLINSRLHEKVFLSLAYVSESQTTICIDLVVLIYYGLFDKLCKLICGGF